METVVIYIDKVRIWKELIIACLMVVPQNSPEET